MYFIHIEVFYIKQETKTTKNWTHELWIKKKKEIKQIETKKKRKEIMIFEFWIEEIKIEFGLKILDLKLKG